MVYPVASHYRHAITITLLHLYLNLNSTGKFELHQRVNGLRGRAVDVYQSLVVAQLELLTALLVYERGAVNREDTLVGGQGNRTAYYRACGFHRFHDFLSRLVHQLVVVTLELDSDFLTHDFFFIVCLLLTRHGSSPLKSHSLNGDAPFLFFFIHIAYTKSARPFASSRIAFAIDDDTASW